MHLRYRFMRTTLCVAVLLLTISSPGAAAVSQQKKLEAQTLLEELITYRTAKGYGQVPDMVDYLEDKLLKAGFSRQDIVRLPVEVEDETVVGLIVRLAGKDDADLKPVAFLAHMDVVDALPKNWQTNPFIPTVKDGYLYGRGAQDNKFGVALLVSTFINLKASGYVPERDLILAFSGDEETGMLTTRQILNHPFVSDAAFALNSDAGGGTITREGTPVAFSMQAAEKIFATFILSTSNPGGHSSVPQPENAIYELAQALLEIKNLAFPVTFNEITRSMAHSVADREGGEIAKALRTLLENSNDNDAINVIRQYPQYANMLWTTCVATMLEAGHAENALPQNAEATVNCRILPDTGGVDHLLEKMEEAVGSSSVQITQHGESVESPASPLRDDIVEMLQQGVALNYAGVTLQPTMSSGGTEGREYRRVGIPTYGAGSLGLVRPDDSRAHGPNERIPLASFYKEMDYWDYIMRRAGRGDIK
ncbi:M20/M25/M40 family metallo-hydrolase [Salinimonas chungwhensis]|uniref:M20/M25/M40 family metallo-hydrolase n=1 Tax=Salinimonas chungwhensis TaxID=265425 RepID=UPI00035C187C|nr:M20/M25/M40 family metallo-hydrolase [Salinimonas chungwhensis]